VPLSGALNRVDWYLYNDSNPTNGIFGTPSGAPLASSSVLPASISITDLGAVSLGSSFNAYQFRFVISPTVIAAGDYWVGFQVFGTGSGGNIFWAQASSGDDLSAILTAGVWTTPYVPDVIYNAVFEVDGDINPSAVPLPATLPLFATGLGALGLLGWRRKRKNAAAMIAA
jgi:PEP-CTERM motif